MERRRITGLHPKNSLVPKYEMSEMFCCLYSNKSGAVPFASVRWVKGDNGQLVVRLQKEMPPASNVINAGRELDQPSAKIVLWRIASVLGVNSFSHIFCNDEHVTNWISIATWFSERSSNHEPSKALKDMYAAEMDSLIMNRFPIWVEVATPGGGTVNRRFPDPDVLR